MGFIKMAKDYVISQGINMDIPTYGMDADFDILPSTRVCQSELNPENDEVFKGALGQQPVIGRQLDVYLKEKRINDAKSAIDRLNQEFSNLTIEANKKASQRQSIGDSTKPEWQRLDEEVFAIYDTQKRIISEIDRLRDIIRSEEQNVVMRGGAACAFPTLNRNDKRYLNNKFPELLTKYFLSEIDQELANGKTFDDLDIDSLLRKVIKRIHDSLLLYFNYKHHGQNLSSNDYQWKLYQHLENWDRFNQTEQNFYNSFIGLLETDKTTHEYKSVLLSEIPRLNVNRNQNGEKYRFNLKTTIDTTIDTTYDNRRNNINNVSKSN